MYINIPSITLSISEITAVASANFFSSSFSRGVLCLSDTLVNGFVTVISSGEWNVAPLFVSNSIIFEWPFIHAHCNAFKPHWENKPLEGILKYIVLSK